MLGKIKKALGGKDDKKEEEQKNEPSGPAHDPSADGASIPPVQSTTPAGTGVSPTTPPVQPSTPGVGASQPATPTGTGGDISGSNLGVDPISQGGTTGQDPAPPVSGTTSTPVTSSAPLGPSSPVTPPAVTPGEDKSLAQQGATLGDDDASVSDKAQDVTPGASSLPSEPDDTSVSPSLTPKVDDSLSSVKPMEPGLSTTPSVGGVPIGSTPSEPQGTDKGGKDEPESSIPPTGPTVAPSPVPSTGVGATSSSTLGSTMPPTATQASQPDAGSSTVPGATADEELKKTHEPVIVLPDRLEMGQTVTIKVRTGMIAHVMEDSHYIQSIELSANDQPVGKVELSPKTHKTPEADFQVSLSAGMKLKAIIYCNVHGKWESELVVQGEGAQ